MTLDEIRKLCREVQEKYDRDRESTYHEDRRDDTVSVYLTLKFKANLNSGKKLLDKM